MNPELTVVMIDSRSDLHPEWVQAAIRSVEKQTIPVAFIVVNNVGRKKTIGECWNKAVAQAETDWILFLGDDDFIAPNYCETLMYYAKRPELSHAVSFTTHMIVFREQPDGSTYRQYLPRPCTGMWKREYVLKYPFNEKLPKGIDREYIEEVEKRGDTKILIDHNIGYFYRQHDDYSCAGKISLKKEAGEIYVNSRYPIHTSPITERLKKTFSGIVLDSQPFDPDADHECKVLWSDWGNENAVKISHYKTDAKKILRIHAYEVFTQMLHYIDLGAFDKVIFVAKHIRDYAEKVLGRRLENAVVIPNGVDTEAFNIAPGKAQNNRIAYAGELSRKKGVQLLLWLARELPDYAFHVAGKFNEPDIAEYFHKRKPVNVILQPYSYDLNDFFKDKAYILNTSPREGCPVTMLQGMAAGLQPLTYEWVGAEDVFQTYYPATFNNLKGLKYLLNLPYDPGVHRRYVKTYHDLDKIAAKFKEILEDVTGGNLSYRKQQTGEIKNGNRLHRNKTASTAADTG